MILMMLAGCFTMDNAGLNDVLWNMGRGEAQVCAGTTAPVEFADRYDFVATVIDPAGTPPEGFDNLAPCWTDAEEALILEDQDGERWAISYAWLEDGYDITPVTDLYPGRELRVVLAMQGESTGFALFNDDEELLYAMEMGRGVEPALHQDDVGVRVRTEDAPVDGLYTTHMQSTDDSVALMPGEDKDLIVRGRYLMACSIDAAVNDEVSWLLMGW